MSSIPILMGYINQTSLNNLYCNLKFMHDLASHPKAFTYMYQTICRQSSNWMAFATPQLPSYTYLMFPFQRPKFINIFNTLIYIMDREAQACTKHTCQCGLHETNNSPILNTLNRLHIVHIVNNQIDSFYIFACYFLFGKEFIFT